MRIPQLEFARLTNLADGIFGVAMTFLAFTIQIPTVAEGPDGGLTSKLTALLPQFLTLAFSDAFSARCCVLHYRMHSVIASGDEWLLILNLCFLCGERHLVSIGVAQFSPWLAIACWPGLLLPGHVLSRWLSLQFTTAGPVADAAEPES